MKTAHFLLTGIMVLTTLAFTGQAAAQGCVDSPAGLLGWWPGDGTGSDIESGQHAKLLNGAGFAPGLVGDAFSLNNFDAGQDDSVVLSHVMVDGLADLTIELWVRTTDTVGGIVSGANAGVNGSNELLLYIESATGLTPWVRQSSSGALSVTLSDDTWHHVAFTRAARVGSLYIDGVLIGALPYPAGEVDLGPHGLQIGQEQDCLAGCLAPDQALDGLFDEIAIYGRALSGAEVMSVFDAGSAGKCKPEPVMDDAIASGDMDALLSEIDALNDRLTAQEQDMDDVGSIAHEHEHDKRKKRKWGHHDRDGHSKDHWPWR
jgi:hypothetical protein